MVLVTGRHQLHTFLRKKTIRDYKIAKSNMPEGSFRDLGDNSVPIRWHCMAISVVYGLMTLPTCDSLTLIKGPNIAICNNDEEEVSQM